MKKAFTIVELLVAMTIIVVLLAGSGYVFHTAVQAEKSARATAEIARKVRGITDQLNADFRELRKDGVMISSWKPVAPGPGETECQRVDQIMFFANGNFSSYNNDPKNIKGNFARIQYTIAKVDPASGIPADPLTGVPVNPADRVLARVQHVYSDDTTLPEFPDLNSFSINDFINNEAAFEYDTITMHEWKNADNDMREEMFTAITDIEVDIDGDGSAGSNYVGVVLDKNNPDHLHKFFCEGVGQFMVQDWWLERWWPSFDPDGDGDYSDDSDFQVTPTGEIDPSFYWWVYYPGEGTFSDYYGRAFKFTFTLYDSYGVFPEGKTFTHIIYLD